MNAIDKCDTTIPVNESLYNGEIKEGLFIGFPIKSEYDHLRFVIPERYNPQRIKYDERCFYGIWVDDNSLTSDNDKVVNIIRVSNKIMSLAFGDGEEYINKQYKNFDAIVYKESPVSFYHKLAQMYIYIFLP